ncbi:hypothetical protein [Pyrobaculum ferrireducens]|uniref:Uncharacterized protein n=1 Tax=Pyrobaculum ferrireducens TaxID=1104324 RepID=G7VE51_9CREN|nr:hypothetical protein [Pyrobaculum ferrireducens]AET32824.1 hypothetical protein P186_1397 [Pyrobaculum ferrireducens]
MAARGWADTLAEAVASSDVALQALSLLGLSELESGPGFRGALSFACRGGVCRFYPELCPHFLLTGAYVLGIFKRLITLTAVSRPTRRVGAEAFGIVWDRALWLLPYGLYENVVYSAELNAPENRLLKFLLNAAERCCRGQRLCGELRTALHHTWLAAVRLERDEVTIGEAVARLPHLRPEYRHLFKLVGTADVGAIGVEYLYRLAEIYVFALVAEAVGAMDVEVERLSKLKASGGGLSVHYQLDLSRCGKSPACDFADVAVSNEKGAITHIIEVKASDYPDYIKEGARQASYYAKICDALPVLAYIAPRPVHICDDNVVAIRLTLDKKSDFENITKVLQPLQKPSQNTKEWA